MWRKPGPALIKWSRKATKTLSILPFTVRLFILAKAEREKGFVLCGITTAFKVLAPVAAAPP